MSILVVIIFAVVVVVCEICKAILTKRSVLGEVVSANKNSNDNFFRASVRIGLGKSTVTAIGKGGLQSNIIGQCTRVFKGRNEEYYYFLSDKVKIINRVLGVVTGICILVTILNIKL